MTILQEILKFHKIDTKIRVENLNILKQKVC